MSGPEWPIEQLVYLTRNYATLPAYIMSEELAVIGPRRGVETIYKKAQNMGLQRPNQGQFSRGRKPLVKNRPAPVRDKVRALFAEKSEWTAQDIADRLSVWVSGVWRVLHDMIADGECHAGEPGEHNKIIYYAGPNEPPSPTIPPPRPVIPPDPIPRPSLGPWNCSW